MQSVRWLLEKIPHVGRRRRRNALLQAARGEIRALRAELALAGLAAPAKPFANRLSKRFQEVFRDERWYILPADDARQDKAIGDLRNYIRNHIAKDDAAAEIGPAHAGILRKRDGYNVTIVDYIDRDSLVRKYEGTGLNVDRIEPVDVVWGDVPLVDAVRGATFHAIVASHVIEHAPDFVSFLNDCSRILKDEGRLYLIVPDRRYEFDFLQPLTDTAKVLGDHRQKRTRHSFESFYREATAVWNGGSHDWDEVGITSLKFRCADPKEALAAAEQNSLAKEYVDNHENAFTPMSFAMLIEELRYLEKLDLTIEMLTRARGCEFLVVLQKAGTDDDIARDAYLERKMTANMLVLLEEMERIYSARKLLWDQAPPQ